MNTTETKAGPPITQLEFEESDFPKAERIAERLGYTQTAYTSTSGLWGLFCLGENPRTWRGPARALEAGCIIKTKEFGLMFIQDLEDLNLRDEMEGM